MLQGSASTKTKLRPGKGVQEKNLCRPQALCGSKDADQKIERHQSEFKADVEENQVGCYECPDHGGFEKKQP